MRFEEVLQSFQQRLFKASHLHAFMKEKPFVILFEVDSNFFTLSLSTSRPDETNTDVEDKLDLRISATENVLRSLLNGDDRLQSMAKRKELILEGSYPAILKAETIFYLIGVPENGVNIFWKNKLTV